MDKLNWRNPLLQERLLIGASILLIGLSPARANTQNEQGDAGDDFASAEVLDAKITKWEGRHESGDDVDLICFYWPGGTFTCRSEPLSSVMDTSILLMAGDGTCYGEADEGIENEVETLTVANLPRGIYYLYGGWWDCPAYDSEANLNTHNYDNAYCGTGYDLVGPVAPPSGSFYGFDLGYFDPVPVGGRYRICLVGQAHVGIPIRVDATSGPSRSKVEMKGNGIFNGGAGQVYGLKTDRIKGRCFFQCRNESANRGASNLRLTGVSPRHFKSKYIDVTNGGNLTAALRRGDYCQSYNAGQSQIVKVILVIKKSSRNKRRIQETAIFICDSASGANRDTAKCKFRFNL